MKVKTRLCGRRELLQVSLRQFVAEIEGQERFIARAIAALNQQL